MAKLTTCRGLKYYNYLFCVVIFKHRVTSAFKIFEGRSFEMWCYLKKNFVLIFVSKIIT